MHSLKDFGQFIGEAFSPEEKEALNYLEKVGLLDGPSRIELLAEELSESFGVKLQQLSSSYQEGTPDEAWGDYIEFWPKADWLPEWFTEASVQVFENGTVQFWYGGVPYPTRHHTEDQGFEMMADEKVAPIDWQRLDRQDWLAFIDSVGTTFGPGDE